MHYTPYKFDRGINILIFQVNDNNNTTFIRFNITTCKRFNKLKITYLP